MAVDYSGFALPKGRPKALLKADKAKALAAKDKAESAKAKQRAGGRCEIVVAGVRCKRTGVDPHHLIYGIGRKNVGKSILAAHKQWACRECHDLIGAKVLQPTSDTDLAAKIRYRRVR